MKNEKLTKETPLFADVREPFSDISTANLQKMFLQISERTGITFSPHDLRRYTQTQLEEAKLQPNWIRKILGKKIRGEENPYSRPKIEQLRKAHREAIPHLIFIDRAPELREDELRKKMVEDYMRMQGFSEEQIERWRESVETMTLEDAIDLARKLQEEKETRKRIRNGG